jgi:hypothetical protein
VRYFNLKKSAAYQGESCYMGYDSWIKTLESRLGSVIGAFGGLFAFRRQFFEPMDPMLPVDLEIPLRVLRQGHKVLFESSAVCVEPASGRVGIEFARHARINARLFYGMGRWIRGLLRPLCPFILFQFVSKKLLRWVSPFLFFALIGMPFFMDGLVYEYLRLFNVLFLCTAGAAVAFSLLGRSQPLLSFALHLLVGNAAVAWGFVAFLTRRQGPTWSVSRN